ncbi:serine/threonine-protein kinase [Frankia nepalensis]|uniref:serine/threonine-protein kinase n=1 Tax=Frankia nepalensis TaxID=1836974 RepID=UPI0019320D51|nr:serine/threonine-protein kinase [Frankia nepalensis]MBL7500356.1 serine/threonine protein kinase [Frankia nepalensis]MBL7508578.1 serine/threonine protein kinase [Frankia nepalensis]
MGLLTRFASPRAGARETRPDDDLPVVLAEPEPGSPLRPRDPAFVGSYRLLRLLGEGGMGTVYLGEAVDGRGVAVKVIQSEYARDPEFRERFRAETAHARQVSESYTAEVLDADPDAALPYLVTEFVPGPTLRAAVNAGGPLGADDLARLAVGMAAALTAIHAAGIAHHDLKPGNVLLGPSGPRVIDFGVANGFAGPAAAQQNGRGGRGRGRGRGRGQAAQEAAQIGTPGYMAPEQARGEEVGPAADVFAWAAVMTFAASGSPPFGEGTPEELLRRVIHDAPDLGALPTDLTPLIAKAFSKDPQDRPSAGDLLLTLMGEKSAQRGSERRPPQSRPAERRSAPPAAPRRASAAEPPQVAAPARPAITPRPLPAIPAVPAQLAPAAALPAPPPAADHGGAPPAPDLVSAVSELVATVSDLAEPVTAEPVAAEPEPVGPPPTEASVPPAPVPPAPVPPAPVPPAPVASVIPEPAAAHVPAEPLGAPVVADVSVGPVIPEPVVARSPVGPLGGPPLNVPVSAVVPVSVVAGVSVGPVVAPEPVVARSPVEPQGGPSSDVPVPAMVPVPPAALAVPVADAGLGVAPPPADAAEAATPSWDEPVTPAPPAAGAATATAPAAPAPLDADLDDAPPARADAPLHEENAPLREEAVPPIHDAADPLFGPMPIPMAPPDPISVGLVWDAPLPAEDGWAVAEPLASPEPAVAGDPAAVERTASSTPTADQELSAPSPASPDTDTDTDTDGGVPAVGAEALTAEAEVTDDDAWARLAGFVTTPAPPSGAEVTDDDAWARLAGFVTAPAAEALTAPAVEAEVRAHEPADASATPLAGGDAVLVGEDATADELVTVGDEVIVGGRGAVGEDAAGALAAVAPLVADAGTEAVVDVQPAAPPPAAPPPVTTLGDVDITIDYLAAADVAVGVPSDVLPPADTEERALAAVEAEDDGGIEDEGDVAEITVAEVAVAQITVADLVDAPQSAAAGDGPSLAGVEQVPTPDAATPGQPAAARVADTEGEATAAPAPAPASPVGAELVLAPRFDPVAAIAQLLPPGVLAAREADVEIDVDGVIDVGPDWIQETGGGPEPPLPPIRLADLHSLWEDEVDLDAPPAVPNPPPAVPDPPTGTALAVRPEPPLPSPATLAWPTVPPSWAEPAAVDGAMASGPLAITAGPSGTDPAAPELADAATTATTPTTPTTSPATPASPAALTSPATQDAPRKPGARARAAAARRGARRRRTVTILVAIVVAVLAAAVPLALRSGDTAVVGPEAAPTAGQPAAAPTTAGQPASSTTPTSDPAAPTAVPSAASPSAVAPAVPSDGRPGVPGLFLQPMAGAVTVKVIEPFSGGPVTSYTVTADPGGVRTLTKPGTIEFRVNRCAEIAVTVQATGPNGASEPSAPMRAMGCVPPGPPGGVLAVPDGRGHLIIGWETPTSVGGNQVTLTYEVTVYRTGPSGVTSETHTVSGHSYTRTAPTAADPYFRVTIAARNAAGAGQAVVAWEQ